jgi:transposase
MARPTLITDELVTRVRSAVLSAQSLEAVAAELGIARRTLFNWLERGEAEQPPESDALFVRFAAEFRQAEADLEQELLDHVKGDAGKKGEWSRFAWVLERRFPARWGSKQRVEHTGADGGAIQVDDARARLLAAVARRFDRSGESGGDREPQSP